MGRHDTALRDARAASTPTVNFGIVIYALEQYGNLVHLCAASPFVAQTDFGYAAPIYKGSPQIKAGLEQASSSIEKFDVYFRHAVLDEEARLGFARAFRAQYTARFPGSERTDLFLASGDVMKFSIDLIPPHALAEPGHAFNAIEKTPHDPAVLQALKAAQPIERTHLRADMKIFFDHIMNPRRHEEPRVAHAATELGVESPFVVEVVTTGALPGYVFYMLQPMVHQVGGRLVLLGNG